MTKNCFKEMFSELVSSSTLFDELMRRPENLKLRYFLEKMTLCDVRKLFSYMSL